jgi:hypothetical protein
MTPEKKQKTRAKKFRKSFEKGFTNALSCAIIIIITVIVRWELQNDRCEKAQQTAGRHI